jgi:hypothetical protein
MTFCWITVPTKEIQALSWLCPYSWKALCYIPSLSIWTKAHFSSYSRQQLAPMSTWADWLHVAPLGNIQWSYVQSPLMS